MSSRPRNKPNKARLNVRKTTATRCKRWNDILDAFLIKPWSTDPKIHQAFQHRLQRGPMNILDMMINEPVFLSIVLNY